MNDECPTCAAKPGSPRLCDACLANREFAYRRRQQQQAEIDLLIERVASLQALLDEAVVLGRGLGSLFAMNVAVTQEGEERLAGLSYAVAAAQHAAKHLDVQRYHDEAVAARAAQG